jgi:hypothetical protein
MIAAFVGRITFSHGDKQGRSRQWVDEDEERGKGDHGVLSQGAEVCHGVS